MQRTVEPVITKNHLPMLAKPMSEKFRPGKQHIAQEKFDGHRMIVLRTSAGVQSWSRTGIDSARKISNAMHAELMLLPPGTMLDGELVTSDERSRSYAVSDLSNHHRLRYMVFDVLQVPEPEGLRPLHAQKLSARISALQEVFAQSLRNTNHVLLAEGWMVFDSAQLKQLAEKVWNRGGEGLIIKDLNSTYAFGKRTNAFLKVKTVYSECVRIVRFEPSTGEINDRGPCGITICEDVHGVEIVLKTLDDATCRQIEKNPSAWIGRKLWIEYFDKTPDGKYLSARWDHGEGW